jgi:chemotaxis protein CheC
MRAGFERFSEILEDLKEVGNIGSGYAASRLSEMIDKRCYVDVPEAEIYNVEEIQEKFFPHDIFAVAIVLKIFGDIQAVMVVLMNKADAQKLLMTIDPLNKRPTDPGGEYLPSYTLKKLGELLTNSFNLAISQFLSIKLKQSMPEIIVDTWSSVIDIIINDIRRSTTEQIVIFSRFFNEDVPFEGKFFYMISSDNALKILNRLRER